MTAKSIVDIARARLGDVKNNRWTDQRMLQIVNQGQASVCKLTGIYRKEAFIPIANNITRYRLPTDCMTVRRLEYKGAAISLYNRDDLDAGKSTQTEFVGIKDNLPMGVIDIYPAQTTIEEGSIIIIQGDTADDTFDFTSVFGVVTKMSNPYSIEPLFGVITGTELSIDGEELPLTFGELASSPLHKEVEIDFDQGIYGVTTGASYDNSTDPKLFGFITGSDYYDVKGQYGLVATVTDSSTTLRVFYEAVPTNLISLSASLVIQDMWEEAMVRYVVGTALQDDNDANNIQRGELELQKFTTDVLKARELATKDFSGGAKEKYHTRFRRV